MDVENTPLRRSRGLTLVELVAVIAVIGISLAALTPSWSGMVQRNRVTVAANQLLAHLRFARNEAVTRNRFVTLCPSVDGARCSQDPQGWHAGYLVFEDRDGNRRRDEDERLLRSQHSAGAGVRLHSTTGRPAIRFRADGAAWSTNTTFSVCQSGLDDPSANRAVVLYGSGRARVDRQAPGNRPVRCG
jgi:type IV fimbrial biogenesis protein FimT